MSIYTETTVEDLLSFIETDIAMHELDANECDCYICLVHDAICGWTILRSKK